MEPRQRKVTIIDTESALEAFLKAHGYAEADLNGLVAELNATPKVQFTDYDERMLRCMKIKI
jgi:hypothetical protein